MRRGYNLDITNRMRKLRSVIFIYVRNKNVFLFFLMHYNKKKYPNIMFIIIYVEIMNLNLLLFFRIIK